MKATFVITVDIDSAGLQHEGKQRGLTLPRTLDSVVSEIEGRLIEAVRMRPCVARVGVTLQGLPHGRTQ